MVDVSQYKVGLVLSVEPGKTSKTLRTCRIHVGDAANPITVVTSATNVREGSRVAVAMSGSTFINAEGEEATVTKTSVGGVMSEGMLCDSRMLGWTGGAEGVAAQMPDSLEIGSAPPASKPRPQEAVTAAAPSSTEVQGLFEKKLSKEEKKKLAEERRKQRKAAKEAKNTGEQESTSE